MACVLFLMFRTMLTLIIRRCGYMIHGEVEGGFALAEQAQVHLNGQQYNLLDFLHQIITFIRMQSHQNIHPTLEILQVERMGLVDFIARQRSAMIM
jgi:hypothetical protein